MMAIAFSAKTTVAFELPGMGTKLTAMPTGTKTSSTLIQLWVIAFLV